MDYFFGYDTYLSKEVDWMFNSNHLFLILFVLSTILALYFSLYAKSEKGIKITKIVLASFLLLLEISRIIWGIVGHIKSNGTIDGFNWWWTISFQMCAIMTWTTIVTLFLSAFLKKDNKVLKILYNILMGCALIGGVLTFCYPDLIHESRPFFHFQNIQTVLVHTLLIFVPIYLLKIKEFKVELKNFIYCLLGFVGVGSIAMTASEISGQNFAYALRFDLLEDVGIKIPFPWHYFVTFAIICSFSLILYCMFELVRYLHNKKNGILIEKTILTTNDKIFYTTYITAIFFGILSLIILPYLAFGTSPIKSWAGLICVLPLILAILIVIWAFALRNKEILKNEKIRLLVVQMLLCFPCGIASLCIFFRKQKSVNYVAKN